MNYKDMKKVIDHYFDTHSQKDILKSMYEDDIKAYKKFDRKLWERIIDEQLELSDEHLLYFADKENMSEFKHIFSTFRASLEDLLPWTQTTDYDFPTMFHVFEHNGKQIVVVLMIGQGSSMDTCTVKGFKKWMKRNKTKFEMPKSITLDEFEVAVKKTLASIRKKIREASDEKGKKK